MRENFVDMEHDHPRVADEHNPYYRGEIETDPALRIEFEEGHCMAPYCGVDRGYATSIGHMLGEDADTGHPRGEWVAPWYAESYPRLVFCEDCAIDNVIDDPPNPPVVLYQRMLPVGTVEVIGYPDRFDVFRKRPDLPPALGLCGRFHRFGSAVMAADAAALRDEADTAERDYIIAAIERAVTGGSS